MKKIVYRVYATLFANRFCLYFNKLLFQLSLRGLGILNHVDYKISGERHLLKNIVPKYSPTLIFDVGANVGNYTLEARKYNRCPIFSFEPNPPTANQLKINIRECTNTSIFEIGMSNIKGSAEIFDDSTKESTSQASLYSEVISDFHHHEVKSTHIALTTIDEFCSDKNIKNISLLKIDTEGNEFKILEGAKQMISANQIDIIHFEFNSMNIASRVYFKDFFKVLSNYNLYRLLPHSILKLDYLNPVEYEIFAFQNIIAIRKDIDKEQY